MASSSSTRPPAIPFVPTPVLIADQLSVRSHRVDVSIADQVATTRIDQVFHNPNSWAAEGTYIFPIPPGAAISGFTMTVDGEPVEAKLLDAEEARRIYDDIVRNLRDPALLEYIGEGAIQASVFPIPPAKTGASRSNTVRSLRLKRGSPRYRYPLNTERFSAQPLEEGQRPRRGRDPGAVARRLLAVARRRRRSARRLSISRRATKRAMSGRTPISSSSGASLRGPSAPAS